MCDAEVDVHFYIKSLFDIAAGNKEKDEQRRPVKMIVGVMRVPPQKCVGEVGVPPAALSDRKDAIYG